MTETHWPVLELRHYTLRPDTRDIMVELFDRELLDPQEALGARILGQFRDEDDPNRWVWLRAFTTMASRLEVLKGFYLESETWRTHAAAARATMVDTSDVLLLRPLPGAELPMLDTRPGREATALPPGRLQATVYHPDVPIDEFADFFDHGMVPVLRSVGIEPLGRYETEPAPNDFSQLPIREGETVFVWFTRFRDADERVRKLTALSRNPLWRNDIRPHLDKLLATSEAVLRLAPTARSALR
ncbi:NIPSNAP family protein [Nocardia sp. CDC160]|uniref:NIPSNAP family protein n=1 Tax=Nocardia sp. CDC160 TaxID=3112166 RepID=UPI002DBE6AA5|nr:NIPSNAP family protein [Nocardia sp. CDC160]MEC3919660.1 NIPSNAP family protein [Nocardia sp. CDC160]